jgi:hypothetical protein
MYYGVQSLKESIADRGRNRTNISIPQVIDHILLQAVEKVKTSFMVPMEGWHEDAHNRTTG